MMLYFAGTMIMYDPSNECIYDFWTQGMIKSLPVSSNNPRFLKAASQLRSSATDEKTGHDLMTRDYLRLFAGAGKALAPPYESVYMTNDRLLYGKNTSEVREFYRSYGWESKFKDQMPDDHLGIELLFLTLMVEKFMELDDEVCNIEMKKEIGRFINQHILAWIPKWNEDVQIHAETMGYKGIGTLIHACVEDMLGILSDAGQDICNPSAN